MKNRQRIKDWPVCPAQGKTRYYLVDALRGFAVLNMIAFHAVYNVCMFWAYDPSWYDKTGTILWQNGICWSFILLSGVVWRWGMRSNWKRGLFLSLCGGLITLATWLVLKPDAIFFGILSFLGCAVLLMIPLHKLLNRVPPTVGLLSSFLLFLLSLTAWNGYLGFGSLQLCKIPGQFYQGVLGIILGFPTADFSSLDYYPLIPWMFLYLVGYFLSPLLFRSDLSRRVFSRRVPFLTFVGQKSLLLYLLHQAILYLLCLLLLGPQP